ncbi:MULTISPECIES: CDP-alcohol phosphatidyltransferase family protein [Halomonas]|uniref:CDP-alcohol phosphatidyltransferase family protein n=1 Tax=Halomonas TaxID=2745 RepID=UPI001C981ADB|nr:MULTISPECIES: CDP-alcohol phosphatidyltransferase family protein [Halomonas]MBY6207044.1 CDP-alcohol phosphatidyltransferase family protein [Halomonas sp. DP3Y7-2]MBY6229638.1 CDP-alcohol phosphatidyltransferase family protein [Halomonas sp. DP3Y7-1]MCA0918030.1 CDP-alcohol phosphatidyltransferase family protein [Halomonas denitrificans]
MASVYDLKPRFQGLLRPLVRRLQSRGVSANQVTLAALLLSLLVAGVVALTAADPDASRGWFLLIALWLPLRMAFNAVDGMLAREHHQQTRLGAYLNELCDLVSDAALFVPFALLPDAHPLPVLVALVMALIVEYAGVMGPLVGASRRYDGPMGKSDRALVIGLLALAIALGLTSPWVVAAVFWLMSALMLVSLSHRVRRGIAEANTGEGDKRQADDRQGDARKGDDRQGDAQ